MAKKGGLITKRDKNAFLKEQYENHANNELQKATDGAYKEPDFYDECPKCNKLAHFMNEEVVHIGKKELVKSHCNKCNTLVYIELKVYKEGDIFSGFEYKKQLIITPMDKEPIFVSFKNKEKK